MPVEYTFLSLCPFTLKCFSICFLHDKSTAIRIRNLTLMYPFHIILRGSWSIFRYCISLVSCSLKQFLSLWPWPFEDYRPVILRNVFQFRLAFMIRSRLYIVKSNWCCFSHYILLSTSWIFVCPTTDDVHFIVWSKWCLPGFLQ